MRAQVSIRMLLGLLLLVSSVLAAGEAPAARSKKARPPALELTAVRLGGEEGRTRLVFDIKGSSCRPTLSRQPATEITVVLPGVEAGSGLSLPRGRAIESIELVRNGKDTQARLRCATPCEAQAFTIPPGAGKPLRVVVDLTPVAQAAKPPGAPAADPAKSASDPVPVKGVAETRGQAEPKGQTPAKKPAPASADHTRIVVIDAGHGGRDPGTVAKGVREKEICLEVAQLMAKAINKTPGFKAVLTRDKDTFIPLRDRMRFAEKQNADLFLSLHVNSAPSRKAQGVEVFYLSLGAASDEASRELARLENEADPTYVVEEDEGLKKLPFMLDLRQSDTLLRSSHAAEVVLNVLTDEKLAPARGVKQAGFAVLKSYQVPSVLVELGFLSSAADREKLKTQKHRQALAAALARGVTRYFEKFAPQRPIASS